MPFILTAINSEDTRESYNICIEEIKQKIKRLEGLITSLESYRDKLPKAKRKKTIKKSES